MTGAICGIEREKREDMEIREEKNKWKGEREGGGVGEAC